MINLTIDEAFFFDIFAITQVKVKKLFGEPQTRARGQVTVLYDQILAQLGEKKLALILASPEYQALFNANLKTFDLVEKVRQSKEQGLAKDIDEANLDRFKAKSVLQKQFFGNKFTEIKT